MDEVGRRIVSNTAAPYGECCMSQCGERYVREPNVDSPPLHVQAASRDSFAVVSKHLIRGGGPVGGNHLEWLPASCEAGQTVEKIEQAGIDRVHLAGAEVAQELVDGDQCVWQVRVATEVLDGESLTRMRVREFQLASDRRATEDLARCANKGEGRRQSGHEVATREGTHGWAARRLSPASWKDVNACVNPAPEKVTGSA